MFHAVIFMTIIGVAFSFRFREISEKIAFCADVEFSTRAQRLRVQQEFFECEFARKSQRDRQSRSQATQAIRQQAAS